MAFAAVPAFAQTGASVNTTAEVKAGDVKVSAAVEAKMTAGRKKADQEIARRITALNALSVRINEMKKLSVNDRATLTNEIQAQVTGLTNLNAKIQADTDVEPLKADVKSVTDSYRIFVLVIPRDRIIAAADRMSALVDSMSVIGAKLELRVGEAKAAGKDTSKLEQSLADLKAKLTSAQAEAQAAVNVVVPLAPDQGDKTVMETNKQAFTTARASLKTGTNDLKSGRTYIKTLVDGLKSLGKIEASATTTVDTNVNAQ